MARSRWPLAIRRYLAILLAVASGRSGPPMLRRGRSIRGWKSVSLRRLRRSSRLPMSASIISAGSGRSRATRISRRPVTRDMRATASWSFTTTIMTARRPLETFADGFVHAMSLAVRFGDGVYLATRKEVFHLTDTDGDGKVDRPKRRCCISIRSRDYPHNGLAGFAFDGLGYLVHWAGRKPRRGLLSGWNRWTHAFGRRRRGERLSLPPRRHRSHAVGDRFLESARFVRRRVRADVHRRQRSRRPAPLPDGPHHPGGRLRLSLSQRTPGHPSVHGMGRRVARHAADGLWSGRAPCGIVAYESDALPAEYRGSLLVTSWGDHRVDRYRFVRKARR